MGWEAGQLAIETRFWRPALVSTRARQLKGNRDRSLREGWKQVAEPGDGAGEGEAMRRRLDALSQDLSRREKPRSTPTSSETGPSGLGQAVGLGFRVTSEFVAAIVVGGLIGWQGDRWLHSSPLLLITFIALGTAAGFWNVYRLAMKTGGK